MRTLLLCISVFVFFAFSQPSFAEVFLTVDEDTAARGVTLQSEDHMLTLGVPPRALSGSSRAVVRVSAKSTDASTTLSPRDGMRYASNLFYYEFFDADSFHADITLVLESVPVKRNAGAYLYDDGSEQWFPLKTTRVNAHSFRAFSDSPKGYLAILEYENDDAEFLSLLQGARAVVAADNDDQLYVVHHGRDTVPLASITKLMTALVFLDHNPGWNTRVTIQKSDDAQPAKIAFRTGDAVSVRELFSGMLVGSKNNAAKALRRSTGLSEAQFVKKMNERARALGMRDTAFVDVTGLSSKNTASARDVIMLLRASMAVPAIVAETSKPSTRVSLLNRKKTFTIPSTNDLARAGIHVAGKTGYIPEAGYNLALMKSEKNHLLYFAILGAPSSKERFTLARALLSRTW